VVGGATPYNNFRCVDGYGAIMCVSNQHWLDLCRLMQRDDLLANTRWHDVPERAQDWRQIEAAVEQWTSTQRRDPVAAAVAPAGIPRSPGRPLAAVVTDRHGFARAVVREGENAGRGTVKVLGTPIKLSGHDEPDLSAPPSIGEHTQAVLNELLGIARAEIAEL